MFFKFLLNLKESSNNFKVQSFYNAKEVFKKLFENRKDKIFDMILFRGTFKTWKNSILFIENSLIQNVTKVLVIKKNFFNKLNNY